MEKRGESINNRGFFERHKFLIAITTLIGTIVGAGILGIPYVIAKTGFFYGALIILVIGISFIFLNLFMGEIVLRTKTQHQLTGYAGKYLGKTGKRLMTLSMFISIYGALTAYLIGEGQTLFSIFKVGFPLLYTLIFFAITFLIIYRGVKATGKAELILIFLLFLIIIIIGIFSANKISLENFGLLDFSKIFIPYGVIVFAFVGSPAIPEMQQELGKNKKMLKKAIIIGSIIPIVLYLVFTFIIMGLIGLDQFEALQPNERIATVALSIYSNPILGLSANILAVLAMFTSFLTLGLALVEVYTLDYGISRRIALLLTFLLPLIITLFNLTTFIVVLAVTGALAGGLEGILIILMYWKSKFMGDRKPEYSLGMMKILGYALIVLFSAGVIYQLFINFII
jgi:tyrosine-specific transport protein